MYQRKFCVFILSSVFLQRVVRVEIIQTEKLSLFEKVVRSEINEKSNLSRNLIDNFLGRGISEG